MAVGLANASAQPAGVRFHGLRRRRDLTRLVPMECLASGAAATHQKGRQVSAGYGFVYEVQFVGEVMIAGFGILFFAGHRALLVAVIAPGLRHDLYCFQRMAQRLRAAEGREECVPATTQLFELCDHIFFV